MVQQRKKKLVYPKVQLALVRRFFLQWVLFVICTAVLAVTFHIMLDPMQTLGDWSQQASVTVGALLVASIALLPIYVVDSLRHSNRIVGPIVRMQSIMREATLGECKEITARKGDFWPDLMQEFNCMQRRMNNSGALEGDAARCDHESASSDLVESPQVEVASRLSRSESVELPKTRRTKSRRGAAAVEFAAVLPLLVLLVLGTIEATSMIFLTQSLKIAAYEGARVALVPRSDEDNVIGAAEQILTARNVVGATVSVTPSNIESQPYGTLLEVKVRAPCGDNSLFAPWFYAGRTLEGRAVMMKERD